MGGGNKKTMKKLTVTHLRQVLDYSQDTGIFRWKILNKYYHNGSRKVGDIAGGFDGKGYTWIRIDGKIYPAHRLAWFYVYGAWPKDQIDHINLNKSDNRIGNLREADSRQNRANSKPRSSSGLKGAHFSKHHRLWRSGIIYKDKRVDLGFYKTAREAHLAYMAVAKKLYGEFVRGE